MPVTMVVETGVGLSTANSYVSLADAGVYWDNRSDTAWAALATDALRESALIKATQYIESHYRWRIGEIKTADQRLGWPRLGARDQHDRTVDGDSIPQALKDAVCELAYKVGVTGLELLGDSVGPRIASASVTGAVSVSYDNSKTVSNVYKLVDQMLAWMAYGVDIQGEVVRG